MAAIDAGMFSALCLDSLNQEGAVAKSVDWGAMAIATQPHLLIGVSSYVVRVAVLRNQIC